MADHATTRPGGRTAAVRRAVLSATQAKLTDSGFHHLDLVSIASEAGVGKTTLYRRWGSPAALVADLLVDMAAESESRSDAGDLRADLYADAELVRRTLADPRQGSLFRSLIAAAACDDSAATALTGFYDTRVDEWAGVVDAAVARGDAPPGTDARAVIRHLCAPLYYRFITSTTPPGPEDVEIAVAATSAAVAAGVFVR